MGYIGEFEKILGIGRESSYGGAGTISEWVNFTEEKFDLDIPLEPVNEHIGERYVKNTFQKARALPSPTLSFPLKTDNGLGVVLRGHFGTEAVTAVSGAAGGTGYKHVFNYRGDAVVDSLWVQLAQIGTNTKNYVGLVPKTLEFNYPQNDLANVNVTFVGQDEKTGTFCNGTYGTQQPFNSFEDLQILIDGTANGDIVDLKIKLDNSAKEHLTHGTFNSISSVTQGKTIVDGSFDIFFQDETERTKFTAKTASTLQAKLTGATIIGTAKCEINIKLPSIEYAAVPIESKEDIIGASVSFKAKYGANSVGTGDVLIEVQNNIVSY